MKTAEQKAGIAQNDAALDVLVRRYRIEVQRYGADRATLSMMTWLAASEFDRERLAILTVLLLRRFAERDT
jgi:hypothetical protein